MDYKQHKGNLRGQIKSTIERRLYNKRIRKNEINTNTDCLLQDSCLRSNKYGCNKECKLYM